MLSKTRSSYLALFSSLSVLATGFGLTGATGCSEVTTEATPDATSGDAGPEASACANEGAGTIEVRFTGVPDGETPTVTLSGPADTTLDLTEASTLAEQPAGTWTVTSRPIALADPIVRTLYGGTPSEPTFCLAEGETRTITIAYSEIATSHKLWTTNTNAPSGQLLGFVGSDLATSGSPNATIATQGVPGGNAGRFIAFDKDGNLWSLGSTTTDALLVRFSAADLGTSGAKTPDRRINPKVTCTPAVSALAFDRHGSLWATLPCANQILRVSPETLETSTEYAPEDDDLATGVEGPKHLAFDADGNMWVSGETGLHRFSAASLAPGQPHVPDWTLTAKAEAAGSELPSDALAFDGEGNLWVTSFGGNVVYKLTPGDVAPADAETKEVIPTIQVTVGVTALIEGIAFDESGGLWLTYGQGKIARLTPTQLTTSSTSASPTVPETIISSSDIGHTRGVAFFPAPAALPLYSSLP